MSSDANVQQVVPGPGPIDEYTEAADESDTVASLRSQVASLERQLLETQQHIQRTQDSEAVAADEHPQLQMAWPAHVYNVSQTKSYLHYPFTPPLSFRTQRYPLAMLLGAERAEKILRSPIFLLSFFEFYGIARGGCLAVTFMFGWLQHEAWPWVVVALMVCGSAGVATSNVNPVDQTEAVHG